MNKHEKELIKLRNLLFNYALSLTKGNYANAEDLVQEVMYDAYKKNLLFFFKDLKYYIKMLKNKYISFKRGNKIFYDVNWVDNIFIEDVKEDDRLIKVRQEINNHKDGWIIREMEKRNLKTMKELSVVEGIKYCTLRQKSLRMKKDIEKKLKGGVNG